MVPLHPLQECRLDRNGDQEIGVLLRQQKGGGFFKAA